MSGILKISNLWGGYQENVNILQGISFEVSQGDIIGIIGLNGSGKSTLGKAILNMLPYRKGEFIFDGDDISHMPTNKLFHRGISIMQQGGRVFHNLSVWENLQLAGHISNSKLAEIIPLLQRPQKELQQMSADKLSGGQKHQLSLAMALASSPRLIILDEPSAGLSPKSTEEMYQILISAKENMNMTIILIEQNIAKAIDYCNWSILLQQGKVCSRIEGNDVHIIESLMFNKM